MWIEIESKLCRDLVIFVIPHVGMWIEIPILARMWTTARVIPHVGMWIEMNLEDALGLTPRSSLT